MRTLIPEELKQVYGGYGDCCHDHCDHDHDCCDSDCCDSDINVDLDVNGGIHIGL